MTGTKQTYEREIKGVYAGKPLTCTTCISRDSARIIKMVRLAMGRRKICPSNCKILYTLDFLRKYACTLILTVHHGQNCNLSKCSRESHGFTSTVSAPWTRFMARNRVYGPLGSKNAVVGISGGKYLGKLPVKVGNN